MIFYMWFFLFFSIQNIYKLYTYNITAKIYQDFISNYYKFHLTLFYIYTHTHIYTYAAYFAIFFRLSNSFFFAIDSVCVCFFLIRLLFPNKTFARIYCADICYFSCYFVWCVHWKLQQQKNETERKKINKIFQCAQQWLLLQLDLESIARQQTVCVLWRRKKIPYNVQVHTVRAHIQTDTYDTYARI